MENAFHILHSRIKQLLSTKGRALIAIDGMAASGKTTLCEALREKIPGCHIVHMDDFTLPFEKRSDGYFNRLLTNADTDRFLDEVMTPLLAGKSPAYSPYRCHPEPGFLSPVTIPEDWRCVIVEGAYCLHPQLFDLYDLRALMMVTPETQRARILRRNGETQLARFESLWIPMENRHIEAHGLTKRCDLLLSGE